MSSPLELEESPSAQILDDMNAQNELSQMSNVDNPEEVLQEVGNEAPVREEGSEAMHVDGDTTETDSSLTWDAPLSPSHTSGHDLPGLNDPISSDFKWELVEALDTTDCSPNYALFSPLGGIEYGVFLPNIGYVELPLSADDATRIKAKATPVAPTESPTELGNRSVHNDTHVWQISTKNFMSHNEWKGPIASLVRRSLKDMGIVKDSTIKLYTRLHKIFFCEEGGAPDLSTDSSEFDAIFGTFVVDMPCDYHGGEIILEHGKSKLTFDMADEKPTTLFWYSDVAHKVLPITSGRRLMLTFNLFITGAEVHPSAAVTRDRSHQLREILHHWTSTDDIATPDCPASISYRLDSVYNHAKLSGETMRGRDVAVIQTLKQLSAEIPFEIFLAQVDGRLSETQVWTIRDLYQVDGRRLGSNMGVSLDRLTRENRAKYDSFISHEASESVISSVVVVVRGDHVVSFLEHAEPALVFMFLTGRPHIFGDDLANTETLKALCERSVACDNGLCGLDEASIRKCLEISLRHEDWELFGGICSQTRAPLSIATFAWLKDELLHSGIPCREAQQGLSSLLGVLRSAGEKCEALDTLLSSSDGALTLGQQAMSKAIWNWSYGIFVGIVDSACNQGLSTIDSKWFTICGLKLYTSDDVFRLNIVSSIRKSPDHIPALLSALTVIHERLTGSINPQSKPWLTKIWLELAEDTARDIEISRSRDHLNVSPEQVANFVRQATELSADKALFTFALKVTAKAPSLSAEDLRDWWLPFLLQLLTWDQLPLTNVRWHYLAGPLLEKYIHDNVGPPPQDPHLNQQALACACGGCTFVSNFLTNSSQREARFHIMHTPTKDHVVAKLDKRKCTVSVDHQGITPMLILTKTTDFATRHAFTEWASRRDGIKRDVLLFNQEKLKTLLGDSDYRTIQVGLLDDTRKPRPLAMAPVELPKPVFPPPQPDPAQHSQPTLPPPRTMPLPLGESGRSRFQFKTSAGDPGHTPAKQGADGLRGDDASKGILAQLFQPPQKRSQLDNFLKWRPRDDSGNSPAPPSQPLSSLPVNSLRRPGPAGASSLVKIKQEFPRFPAAAPAENRGVKRKAESVVIDLTDSD